MHDGDVVIAAITSCTNTSNPSVMVAAGLLARNAVARGLKAAPHVKTSLAPGSRVVTDYLAAAGLQEPLDALGFQLVGYGCTTCIGNSGPLSDEISQAVRDDELAVCAVLSGNRNFEGRIHPLVRASYLASPPLVVAYALAGSISVDLEHEPLGTDADGADVYLRDLWPSSAEVRAAIEASVTPELFEREYATIWDGDERWRALPAPEGALFDWAPDSTYVREPSFFQDLQPEPEPLTDIEGARCLVVLGDSVTTDHISPAGAIPRDMPAGRYLLEHGVEPRDFNSFGARRGNHEVMVRGTFGNIRLRNALADGREGGYTAHLPSGRRRSRSSTRPSATAPRACRSSRSWARSTAPARRATGPPRARCCSASAPSSPRATSGSTAPTSSAWACCRWSTSTARPPASLGLDGRERFTIHGIAGGVAPQRAADGRGDRRRRPRDPLRGARARRLAGRRRVPAPRRHPPARPPAHDRRGLIHDVRMTTVPSVANEPILTYAPGSPERADDPRGARRGCAASSPRCRS